MGIITGKDQSPFQCGEEKISVRPNCGKAFVDGKIRVDTLPAVSVSSMQLARFTDGPSCAIVLCDEPGCLNTQGMNRIGRDHDHNAFTGVLHELIVYDRRLSAEEVHRVERHFSRNWPKLEVFDTSDY